MPGFDAEWYLRELGERALVLGIGRNQGRRGAGLTEAARALVAVGAIDLETAQSLLDDYGQAEDLRSQHGMLLRHRFGRAPAPSPPAGPRRVHRCAAHIEHSDGTIHVSSVTLSGSEVSLKVRIDLPESAASGRRRGRMMPLMTPASVTVTDDRGGSALLGFSGGWSERTANGRLESNQPLALDTAWIEVDGTRIDLSTADPPAYESGVERRPAGHPAHDYLWHTLASSGSLHRPMIDIEPSLAALLACGALERDDPVVESVRLVAEAQLGQSPSGTALARREDLPEAWRSVLGRRAASSGPVGAISAGVVLPRFDGVEVVVDQLDSHATGLELEVEISPVTFDRGPVPTPVGQPLVAWWARDDRGGHYLGSINGWSGGPDRAQGTIVFPHPVDPKASELTLMPSTQAERAWLRIPLEWIPLEPETGT